MSIALQNIVRSFGGKKLFQDFTCEIPDNTFVAVIGHNGVGKSTLFRMLTGELIPDKGTVKLRGKLLSDWSVKELAGEVALLPQKNPIGFSVKALDLATMGRNRFKRSLAYFDAVDFEKTKVVFDQLGIIHLSDKDILTLSGGELQLVWIAQLILQEAAIWLLDEPTQSLDVYNKKQLFDLMQKMAESDHSIICITHDLHYLKDMKGFVLNLSREKPQLQNISADLIEEEIRFLESPSGNP